MNQGAAPGAIPAKVLENMRPTVIAGLAKLVELVKKYAAAIYVPTAAGISAARLLRASAKMTTTSPAVATVSARTCPGVSLSLTLIVTAGRSNIRLARAAPATHPRVWAGR